MRSHQDSSPLQLSALQMAWLRELGVEKPWIPAPVPGRIVATGTASKNTQSSSEVAVPQEVNTQSIVSDSFVSQKMSAPKSSRQGLPIQSRPSGFNTPRVEKPLSKVAAPITRGGSAETENLARSAQSIEALSEAISACQACGLCMDREKVVVGQGVMRPAVMVVGEAPGEQEDRQGEPFVGRSGMLLDNMLSSIDCGREKNVYVANVIKCRPPGNRNPRPEEIAACKPFLLRQIELVNPMSILAVGKHAAQSLIGVDAPLTSMREQTYTLPHPGFTVPVVVTYHPAYLLRRQTEKSLAWKDLNQVKALVQAMTGDE